MDANLTEGYMRHAPKVDEDVLEVQALMRSEGFDDHIITTLISLFWLVGMPIVFVICSILWHIWTLFCDLIEAACSGSELTSEYITINECTNPQVAKILSPLPPDFDFKHVCDNKSVKGNPFGRPMITV
ncbi:hypothetical protein EGW08_005681 [Elysia chlorotica]|uniref:Uncharacterized protein n=1 Tax=Elysia chlorotica TaxID=188477 RepID=A0A3S1BQV5_ELYCH|nr:hypothetical protein EGW08_005681 [Elysia chlorotica]